VLEFNSLKPSTAKSRGCLPKESNTLDALELLLRYACRSSTLGYIMGLSVSLASFCAFSTNICIAPTSHILVFEVECLEIFDSEIVVVVSINF